ncbi:MRC1-like domain-containing protein [Delphinella strobiligena]|nr:MRC1-like domain-containing protein [Delphinella strobiligena]
MSSPMRSTRSSRASTPASNDGATTVGLLPRSRIQAMLAEIDADSEDEATASKTETSIIAKSATSTRDKDASASEQDDDDDVPVIKPRGRLAARMGASAAQLPFQEEAEEESEEDSGNVYQRIRREMLAEKTEQMEGTQSTEPDQEVASPPRRRLAFRAQVDRNTPSPPRRPWLTDRAQKLANSPAASTRSESPGLFMSPAPARAESRPANDSDSDSDLPDSEGMKARLRELVERRRRERLAKEDQEREEQERGQEQRPNALLSDMFDDEEEVDNAAEKRLTQQSRPSRKASKKALEEMSRETQRMSRNMQLTHQAKTKKKFTTADFLSRFAGKSRIQTPLAHVDNAADSSSTAAPDSDAEMREPQDTPPSSPPSVHDEQEKSAQNTDIANATGPLTTLASDDEDLPDIAQLTPSQSFAKADKGKDHVRPQSPQRMEQKKVSKKLSPRKYRIVPPPKPTQDDDPQDDSDSDLEIIKGDRVSSIFSSVGPSKASESRPLHMLRHLAHLHQTDNPRLKKGERPSMTPGQLEIELRRRAKIQALREREEKIASLKARGIIVMTAEEREQEQVVIENMLDKAREEADALRKKERKDAKEAGLDVGDASSDESEDGDFIGSGEEDEAGDAGDAEEIDLSGSEDEVEEDIEPETNDVLDNKAGEDAETSDQEQEQEPFHTETDRAQDAMELTQDDQSAQIPQARRAARKKRVIEDDDDEDEAKLDLQTPASTNTGGMINDDLAAAFGFGAAPALGVSQMFAGTMADTQDSTDESVPGDTFPETEQDSLDMLRHIPSAPLPTFVPAEQTQDSQDNSIVADSQSLQDTRQEINLNSTQLETPSLSRIASVSQFGELDFTPSQDVGMKADQTPLKLNLNPPISTQDTVLMDVPESPVVQQAHRRGRLVRRAAANEVESDDEEIAASTVPQNANAFEKMRKAAVNKPVQADFDKKASEARKMVEEQAEESEDEYAGLGGGSDDEHVGEEDEADRAMIDESEIAVNERELAAFYAEKARQQNEAETSKLYKDLMSGAMRKKRGAGGAFDLDSDEDEQVAERRRRRQREEARKRRLLLQDESVGKLGTNEKKEAFLCAIEDREEDDEMDLLDGVNDEAADPIDPQAEQSQVPEGEGSQQPLAETSGNALKRKDGPSESQERTRPNKRLSLRRNPLEAFRAPRSLQEVRESVSFLIEDAHIDPEANGNMFDSDPEDNDEFNYSNQAPRAPAAERRTQAKAGVVDRLTLKKQSSSVSIVGEGSGEGMAFTTASMKAVGSFSKGPSLLRRATTNTSIAESTTSMGPPPRRANREDSGSSVRMGGSKKSSINYQAREAERKIVLEKAERKRKADVRRSAGLRRGGSGFLGNMDANSGFE